MGKARFIQPQKVEISGMYPIAKTTQQRQIWRDCCSLVVLLQQAGLSCFIQRETKCFIVSFVVDMTSQGQADSFRATCNFEYSSFFPGCFCGPGQKCQAKVPEKLHSPSGAQKTQLKCKRKH